MIAPRKFSGDLSPGCAASYPHPALRATLSPLGRGTRGEMAPLPLGEGGPKGRVRVVRDGAEPEANF